MKSTKMVFMIGMAAIIPGLLADTTTIGPDGILYQFTDWSNKGVHEVKSEYSAIKLLHKSCTVFRHHPQGTTTYEVDYLVTPDHKEIWLGKPAQKYFILNTKIWGITSVASQIKYKVSESIVDDEESEKSIINRFKTKLLSGLINFDYQHIGLNLIYGLYTFTPRQDISRNWAPDQIAVITDVAMNYRGATIMLKALRSDSRLSITLGQNSQIIGATLNERPMYVLFENYSPPEDLKAWIGVNSSHAMSPQGKMDIMICQRDDYTGQNATGREVIIGTARAVIMPETGDVWLGPEFCPLIVMDGKMIGFQILKNQQDLAAFTGPRVRLPASPASARIFQETLREYEQELEASERRFNPDWILNLPNLAATDKRLPVSNIYSLRKVDCQGNEIRIILSVNGVFPMLLFNSDLQLNAIRVLTDPYAPELSGDKIEDY